MKTLSKIIFILFAIIFSAYTYAGFLNTYDFVDSSVSNKKYDKPDGTNTLFVYEDYYINPFLNKVIVDNPTYTNNTLTNSYYTVGGTIFTSGHGLFLNNGNIYEDWKSSFDGKGNTIKTKIVLLEDTYKNKNTFGYYTPNQSIKVRKYYEVQFNHDTTVPSCGGLKLYNDSALTIPFTYTPGTWLNSEKYYTINCTDDKVNCKCDSGDTSCEKVGSIVRTPAKVLGHKTIPSARFKNVLDLENTNCSVGGAPQILYDEKSAKIELTKGLYDFNINLLSNKTIINESNGKNYFNYNTTKTFLADSSEHIKINIKDFTENGSLYGISGLKSYNVNVFKKTGIRYSSNITSCNKTWSTSSSYNPTGNKTTEDEKNIDIDCEANYKSGNYKINIQVFDQAGNETNFNAYYTIFPNELDQSNTTIVVDSNGDKFANNSDLYTYTLNLKDKYGNPIYNKSLTSVIQDPTNTIKTILSTTGNKAILEKDYSNITNYSGSTTFKIKSLAPGFYSQKFNITINKWDDSYSNISTQKTIIKEVSGTNSFKKPFIISLSVSNGDENYNKEPLIGTIQKYKFNLFNPGNISGYSNGKTNISTTTIKNNTSGHIFQDFSNIDNDFGNNYSNYLGFTAKINATNNALIKPVITTNFLNIEYDLGGEKIKFNINGSTSASDNSGISKEGTDKSNLGLKVLGTTQSSDTKKASETGQKSNFSDLSKSNQRTEIRKNATLLIKSMKSSDIINSVKYIEGDITISGNNLGYETLIVKNGNVIISGNLNTNGKKLGIIVLKDGYNVDNGYTGKGNIYIDKNVQYINSMIYTDGGIISSNGNTPYISDNTIRTNSLINQLVIKGSIFTRNTIGGAILGSTGKYKLPGGQETTDFNKAMIYDLNYIRIDNENLQTNYNGGNSDNFVIIYNSSIQTNPPKGFSSN